eukprot:10131072-Alexandrium_andersonii.AAC.1
MPAAALSRASARPAVAGLARDWYLVAVSVGWKVRCALFIAYLTGARSFVPSLRRDRPTDGNRQRRA